MNPMKNPPVGTILHAYSNVWRGPRPAIVVMSWPDSDYANVNVFFDGANDSACLAAVRASSDGNTFCSVRVTPPLTTSERDEHLRLASQRPWPGTALQMIVEHPSEPSVSQ